MGSDLHMPIRAIQPRESRLKAAWPAAGLRVWSKVSRPFICSLGELGELGTSGVISGHGPLGSSLYMTHDTVGNAVITSLDIRSLVLGLTL